MKDWIKDIVSEYDSRQKRMVLSSKRVCGMVSHFVCLVVVSIITFREGMTDAMRTLWEVEIIGTLALLGITQFGKYIGGTKDESAE